MPWRISNTENFSVNTTAAVTVAARARPWTARVSADIMIHVKVMGRDLMRLAGIEFADVAEDGETVTITWYDGEVTFTFGDGTGGTVDKGATAHDSAQNLRADINTFATANGLDLLVTGNSTSLAIVTNDPFFYMDETETNANFEVNDFTHQSPASENDAPFTEFDDLYFAVGAGEALSFLGAEDFGFCSVSEVLRSS